jgi:hypothetical protein
MATAAQRKATEASATEEKTEGTTTLDSDVTKPSVTAPGDGPADTTDPAEQAVSVPPRPDEEALKVGTVNAVQPAPEQPKPSTRSKAKARTEEYEATKPDGEVVTIVRNIDTGESKIKE